MSLLTKKRKRLCIPSEWNELPATVIEQIYANLDGSDRFNMSLVCKSWSQEYGSPSLWKAFSFNFKKSTHNLDIWPEVKFAQKFGCMFRNVEITVPFGITQKAFKKAIEQLNNFFIALKTSKSQLLSIKFTNNNDGPISSFRFWHRNEFANLIQIISNFMKSQSNLQTVEFFYCDCKDKDGVNLLILICENNAHTLKTLVLDQFTRSRFENEDGRNHLILQYRTLMQSFMNLEILKTDYSQFFENTMCSLSDEIAMQGNLTKKLSLIELECNDCEVYPLKGIMPIVWKNLRRLCPDLKVHFRLIYEDEIRHHFTFYLRKYIPLALLDFWLYIDEEDNEGFVIGDLLRHLYDCRAIEHLEHLKIVWIPAVRDISIDFIPFLQACQKLKTLEIFLSYQCAGLKELFESWLQSCPVSLESVHVSMKPVIDEGDTFFLKLLAYEYRSLLKTVGLNLTLLINSSDEPY